MPKHGVEAGIHPFSDVSSPERRSFLSMPNSPSRSDEASCQDEQLHTYSSFDRSHFGPPIAEDGSTGKGKGKGRAKDDISPEPMTAFAAAKLSPPSALLPAPAPASIHVRTRYQVVDIPTQIGVEGQGRNFDDILHPGITCDGPHCKANAQREHKETIWGNRFHCMCCENVDFCSRCICEPANKHDAHHGFVRCLFPVRIQRLYPDNQKDWEKFRALYPEHKNVKLSHLIVTETLTNWVPPSIRSLLPECGPAIFGVSPNAGLRPEKHAIVRPDREPEAGEDYVTAYDIDSSGKVAVSYQKATDPRRDVRQQGVLHHDLDTLMAAMKADILEYNYSTRREFYDLVAKTNLATRVIDIKPGKFGDKVEFELRAIDLDSLADIKYETLSYTWKETAHDRSFRDDWKDAMETTRNVVDIKRAFYCDNEYIEVSQGLYGAVTRMRDSQMTRTLWIDQVCINQRDDEEKTFQVQQMAEIYRRATCSTLWVGEHDEDSRKALHIIHEVAKVFENNPELTVFSNPDELIPLSEGKLPPPDSTDWLSALAFFLRPVWNRVWIIQEFVLAPRVVVQCGEDKLPLQIFITFAKLIVTNPWIQTFVRLGASKEMIENQSNLIQVVQMNGIREDWLMGKTLSIEKLLYLTASFQATDPRDKIYGILGIQSPRPRSPEHVLVPDYSKSLSDTMTGAAKHVISKENSLALLGMVPTMSARKSQALPSWCPDLSAASPMSKCSLNRPVPPPPYSAHGDSEITVMWPYESHPNLLITSSSKIDTVAMVTQDAITNKNLGSVVVEGSALASRIGCLYKTGEPIEEVFCRVLQADATFMFRKPLSADSLISTSIVVALEGLEYLSSRREQHETADLLNPVLTALAHKVGDMDEADFQKHKRCIGVAPSESNLAQKGLSGTDLAFNGITTTCNEKRIFRTEECYLGIGAMDAKPGDEIHILSGAKVPVILRPVDFPEPLRPDDFDDSLKSYIHIGEAYVHGIMSGELCQGDDVAWQGICIH